MEDKKGVTPEKSDLEKLYRIISIPDIYKNTQDVVTSCLKGLKLTGNRQTQDSVMPDRKRLNLTKSTLHLCESTLRLCHDVESKIKEIIGPEGGAVDNEWIRESIITLENLHSNVKAKHKKLLDLQDKIKKNLHSDVKTVLKETPSTDVKTTLKALENDIDAKIKALENDIRRDVIESTDESQYLFDKFAGISNYLIIESTKESCINAIQKINKLISAIRKSIPARYEL